MITNGVEDQDGVKGLWKRRGGVIGLATSRPRQGDRRESTILLNCACSTTI
jgi:hypothetical protein